MENDKIKIWKEILNDVDTLFTKIIHNDEQSVYYDHTITDCYITLKNICKENIAKYQKED